MKHYPCHVHSVCDECLAWAEMKVEIPYPFLDIEPPDMCPDCRDNIARVEYYDSYTY